MISKECQILDCTIRDGSYSIKYQFTAEDTYIVTASLTNAGIKRIEVGHGLGLDAQHKGKGIAAESDIKYIEAAKAASEDKTKIGVFFIPGIGENDSIRKAADAGLDFIRIGTNIDQYKEAEESIKLSKRLGLEVWSNLMKSYIFDPKRFGETCMRVADFGVDVVVLVDSAGGMIPNTIKKYTNAAISKLDIPIGFHGHNNLCLVTANCLAFVESGGTMVDCSLRGMGRSAGNAATELIVSLLHREGYDIGGIDWKQLMILAEQLIKPHMPRDTGLFPVEIATGLSLFHSSFQPIIEKASADQSVSAFRTILELDEKSRSLVTDNIARKAAKKASKLNKKEPPPPAFDFRWMQRIGCASLEELKIELDVLSSKTGFKNVITLAKPSSASVKKMRITPIRFGHGYCVGHVEVAKGYETDVVRFFQDNINLWLADRSIQKPKDLNKELMWLSYDDDLLIVIAINDILKYKFPHDSIYLPESDDRIVRLARNVIHRIVNPPCNIGLALSRTSIFSVEDINKINDNGVLILMNADVIEPDALQAAQQRNMQIWRPDLSVALLTEVVRTFDNAIRLKEDAGRKHLDNIDIVAGGVVGKQGDIVVNSISRPTTILGKSDGYGGLNQIHKNDEIHRQIVLSWMLKQIEID